MAEQQGVRLNKYLAECGICSRREADRLIDSGKVKIDGRIASMGDRVTDRNEVQVHGKKVQSSRKRVVLAFNKPVGVTCTEKDPHAKITITDYMKYPIRVTYAGRLDKDSEGLIIMSNDGDLIQKMTRAVNKHEKEYIVKVDKAINDEFLKKMGGGIYLKELDATTRTCNIQKIGTYTFRIILTQGLNRQIRRMCQYCGYEVKQLKRVRVMNIELGKLKEGTYRELYGEELEELYRQCVEDHGKNS
ncbi:MAG: pseudouridine synthase [Lachnospiraceae bacterium]|nr:pseudouridine synthase [Lachnospiraceae bacterium]